MKTTEREIARRLRSEGRSIKEIARMVGVSVSSASMWVRDIELSAEALSRLAQQNPARNPEIARRAALARSRSRRLEWQAHGRALAREGSSLHQLGCMLYWAEGSRSLNSVHFTNSDPEMVRLFVKFLATYFDPAPETISLRCHLYVDHLRDQHRLERFWLRAAGLPPESLRRTMLNRRSRASKGKRTGCLPYGTCRVNLHRAVVVQSIYGAIQEYGGFERSEWLG
jgi:transcriptional regulator with XRE-family HTH domain